VHVRTWPRSGRYYLSLFRRRDLWDQVPREVVFESPPQQIGGVRATFDRGLSLLGHEVDAEALQRHEFFVTTWWRVDGPAEPDTYFFLHLETSDKRITYDHIPGDWMYPANRWRKGDIIENRVLVQVPVGYGPGDYEVWLGVYRRSTGERWKVLEGPNDAEDRVRLGTLTIKPLLPLIHSTIPRTDLTKMRAHPERISPHGRRAGE